MLNVNLRGDASKDSLRKPKARTSLLFEVALGVLTFVTSVGITLWLIEIDRQNPNNPARLRSEVDSLKRRLEQLERK